MIHAFHSLILMVLLALPSTAIAHPQDGPHCDLRIAVGDESVTWNIGMNLAFADALIGPNREAIDTLAPIEEPALERALIAHFKQNNRVVVNGVAVEPVVREWQIGRAKDELLPLFPLTGRLALTRMVCVLEYPAPDGVESIQLTWDGYPTDVIAQRIEPGLPASPMALEAQLQAEGRVDIIRFLESAPTVTWTATGADPFALLEPVPATTAGATPTVSRGARTSMLLVLGLVTAFAGVGMVLLRKPAFGAIAVLGAVGCAALGVWSLVGTQQTQPPTPIDDQRAASIVHPLLRNAYAAFAHTDESIIYDVLARSSDGDVLDRLYREVYGAMVVSDHDMGRAIVSDVTPSDVTRTAERPEGFDATATWETTGSIYHWGHSHDRTYKYTADLTVSAIDGAWKITGLTITDQERTDDVGDAPPAELPEGFEL